ncbi:MAG: hypothetical protein KGL31_13630 [candidate division NC10 bacterium]|nr:hypothetical protein [candidate division NC10 bacterium]
MARQLSGVRESTVRAIDGPRGSCSIREPPNQPFHLTAASLPTVARTAAGE